MRSGLLAALVLFGISPSTHEKLASVGVVVSPMPPDELGAFIRSEIARWSADAKAAGIEAK